MKIRLISSKGSWTCSHTGKGFFVSRLIPELEKLGVEVVQNTGSHVDIDMQIACMRYKPENCDKFVLRVGPPFFSSHQNYKKLNKPRIEAMHRADGVIYQSQFGKKISDVILGKAKCKSTVIFNGDKPKELPVSTNQSISFLASTREWIPQKRLKDIIKSFRMTTVPNTQLYVAGESKYGVGKWDKDERVTFLGPTDRDRLSLLYRICRAMIHIVWLDVCPNSVAEALTAGCPVICSNQGGTRELVEPVYPKLVLPLDKEYDFRIRNLEDPPDIDRNILAEAITKTATNPVEKREAKHVDISEIAKQYKEFFQSVL